MPYKDPEKERARLAARRATPEWKAYMKAYSATPERRAYERLRSKTPERREHDRKRNAKPERSAYQKAKALEWRRQNYDRQKSYQARKESVAHAIYNAAKKGPCADCKQTFHPVCMDWDHLPGVEKTIEVSRLRYASAERLQVELAKCELVCANCHRLRTLTRKEK